MAVSTWQAKYQNDVTNLATLARAAASFSSSQGSRLARFRGGIPSAVLSTIAIKESSGRMVAGDASLGEYGFFQITSSFPESVGLSPSLRETEEGNIFLAGLEYNIEAARLKVRYPNLIVDGSTDQWMMSRATFALGIGAVKNLINLVAPSRPGKMFADILAYADANPAVSVSGYEAGKVWYRLKSIPLIWEAASRVGNTSPGRPVAPPAPLGLSYTIPKDVRSVLLPQLTTAGFGGGVLLPLGIGAGLFFLLKKLKR